MKQLLKDETTTFTQNKEWHSHTYSLPLRGNLARGKTTEPSSILPQRYPVEAAYNQIFSPWIDIYCHSSGRAPGKHVSCLGFYGNSIGCRCTTLIMLGYMFRGCQNISEGAEFGTFPPLQDSGGILLVRAYLWYSGNDRSTLTRFAKPNPVSIELG